ncbi:glycosyltransferase [Pararobbsia alpina]|uniref:Glycosyltransferase 2-like domain-containing protein n=1 Tax=Pararobbsia alpina TaxID=621374 RepID=A0A6S7BKG3_9BURK|nr:glycosyltransferase [Pararobbsia alpina]CAB3803538.1 hypothetical protein LMG28138_05367 [Pararobbsia alpina]
MQTMKISVAMAAYNGEAYIREQLDSIAKQTLLPDELVITDDSPDRLTEDAINAFKVTSPVRIDYYRNETRQGFPENFFKAIGLCKGELIAFADQDDVWMPRKLELMTAQFADPEVMLVTHKVTIVDSQLKVKEDLDDNHWSYVGTFEPLQTDPWYLLFGMSAMVRGALFRVTDLKVRPLDFSRDGLASHDMWAWFMGGALGKIVGLPDKLALYRQHAVSVVGAPKQSSLAARIAYSIKTGRSHYDKMASISHDRAKVLSQVTQPDLAARARAAETFYMVLYQQNADRASLYAPEKTLIERASAGLRLLRKAGYRPQAQGGFGLKALFKDLFLFLLVRRVA